MRTSLYHVTGLQPEGIKSLKLEDWYRTILPRQAAELANNYWKLNGVALTFFEVTYYLEPETVGRITVHSKAFYKIGKNKELVEVKSNETPN